MVKKDLEKLIGKLKANKSAKTTPVEKPVAKPTPEEEVIDEDDATAKEEDDVAPAEPMASDPEPVDRSHPVDKKAETIAKIEKEQEKADTEILLLQNDGIYRREKLFLLKEQNELLRTVALLLSNALGEEEDAKGNK